MAGKADIVFCLDASASMQPCIDGVREHLGVFLDSLQTGGQTRFECRLDFVAHRAGEAPGGGGIFHQTSVRHQDLLQRLYFPGYREQASLFTTDPEEFRRALAAIRPSGDEAPLVALDSCLDFPWSADPGIHRVVIVLTDEPFETGVWREVQVAKLAELKAKIQKLKVLLFIVGPESAVFDQLSAVDRCEYDVIDGSDDGLRNVDLRKVLSSIGRSVSVSRLQAASPESVTRGIFGQAQWGQSDVAITGA